MMMKVIDCITRRIVAFSMVLFYASCFAGPPEDKAEEYLVELFSSLDKVCEEYLVTFEGTLVTSDLKRKKVTANELQVYVCHSRKEKASYHCRGDHDLLTDTNAGKILWFEVLQFEQQKAWKLDVGNLEVLPQNMYDDEKNLRPMPFGYYDPLGMVFGSEGSIHGNRDSSFADKQENIFRSKLHSVTESSEGMVATWIMPAQKTAFQLLFIDGNDHYPSRLRYFDWDRTNSKLLEKFSETEMEWTTYSGEKKVPTYMKITGIGFETRATEHEYWLSWLKPEWVKESAIDYKRMADVTVKQNWKDHVLPLFEDSTRLIKGEKARKKKAKN